jgi:hypothetical protein
MDGRVLEMYKEDRSFTGIGIKYPKDIIHVEEKN